MTLKFNIVFITAVYMVFLQNRHSAQILFGRQLSNHYALLNQCL